MAGEQEINAAQQSGAVLAMMHKMYTEATEVQGPNENITIPVARNVLKFSVNVTGWVFASPDNKLALDVKVSSNGGASASGKSASRYTMDTDNGVSMELDLETVAYVDGGIERPVELSNTGNVLTLTFPNFEHSVWYDPTLSANGAAAYAVSVIALLLSVIAGFYTTL